MKLQRFIGPFDLAGSSLAITKPEIVHQLKKVFRLNAGSRLIVCDGNGTEAEVVIQTIDQRACVVRIEKRYQNNNEPQTRVHLFCSLLKRENFELVTQKTTEIGVAEITPLLCERTVKTNLNLERLKKIAREAAEQSGRGFVPTINEPESFKSLLTFTPSHFHTFSPILFDPAGSNFETSTVSNLKTLSVFVGPEGGWSPEELKLARARRFLIASLGPLTLRAETAAIVASYLCAQNTK